LILNSHAGKISNSRLLLCDKMQAGAWLLASLANLLHFFLMTEEKNELCKWREKIPPKNH
jgi:hypothetical protein